ncbi:MAG TPA: TonB-dependent receptor, partial [Myxococcaceae bacterium]
AEDLIISAENLYNPSGAPVRALDRGRLGFGPFEATQELTTFRLVTGLGGKFSERFGPLNGFRWELAYQHARSQGVLTQQGLLQRSRLSAAVGPSFIDPDTGEATCGTPSDPIEDCVPLNLFGGQEGITAEMAEFLRFEGISRGSLRQTSVTAHLVGELFKLTPDASAASLAVGYEHRRQAGAYVPDPLAAKGDALWLREAAGEGRFYVNEAYAELSVPVLGTLDPAKGTRRDMLKVNGAARVYRYNTFGTDFAYLLGTRLGVIPDVTVRAAHSRDFRSPTAAAVSQGQLSTVRRMRDPCSAPRPGILRVQGTSVDEVCDAQGVPDDLYDARVAQQVLVGGNPALEPETASNFTVGLVLAPRFLNSFTASVDYSRLQVDRAIVRVGETLVVSTCYPTWGSRSLFCDTIERNEQGLISAIRAPLRNEGTHVRSGVDLFLDYRPLTPLGLFGFNVDASWVLKSQLTLADGSLSLDNPPLYQLDDRTGLRAKVGVSWARSGLGISARLHFVNGFRECTDNSCTLQEEDVPALPSRQVNDYYALDVSVAYAWQLKSGTATAQLGATNVFDAAPAFIANGFTGISDPTLYSYRGRHFYLRLSYSYD